MLINLQVEEPCLCKGNAICVHNDIHVYYIAQQQLTDTGSFYVYLGVLLYQPKHMQNGLWQRIEVAQQHHSTYSAHSVSTFYMKTIEN